MPSVCAGVGILGPQALAGADKLVLLPPTGLTSENVRNEGAKGIATRNKKLLGAPGRTTRSKKLLGARGRQWVVGALGEMRPNTPSDFPARSAKFCQKRVQHPWTKNGPCQCKKHLGLNSPAEPTAAPATRFCDRLLLRKAHFKHSCMHLLRAATSLSRAMLD